MTEFRAASGLYPLADPADAFAARYLLAAAAERTLDVQYYIWRNDLSGTLLMKALVDAADRGVQVRLLLDDNNTSGLDPVLATVDSHPGIDVRVFNAFRHRRSRTIGYLTDFPRLNRRMHNKSFTADCKVTIIGGRNVGDEYFGAGNGALFADFDVMAVGPVVRDVSDDFERYWSSEFSVPVARLLQRASDASVATISSAAERVIHDPRALRYEQALRQSSFVLELLAGTLHLEWSATHMISDPPQKIVGRASHAELMMVKLEEVFAGAEREIDIVSPYFVPAAYGVDLFASWTRRGVRVRVLTNSLEATNVAIVHSGYVKWRRALLAAGVQLWEMRSRGVARPSVPGFGSSGGSLHAKTFAVDRSRLFIGSFNFDPRSAELNTEMGFVIESPVLAERLSDVFDRRLPAAAYEVSLSGDNLQWAEGREGSRIFHRSEPGVGLWKRSVVTFMSALPIERLL